MRVQLASVAAFGPATCAPPVPATTVPDEELAEALRLRGLRPLSRTARLAMVAAARAWPEALQTDSADAAVVLGSAWASAGPLADFVQVAAEHGPDQVFPMAFPNTVVSVHGGYVASLLGCRGPVVSPCGPHAGVEALAAAVALVAGGRAPRALAVAADAVEPPLARLRPDAREGAVATLVTSPTAPHPPLARRPDGEPGPRQHPAYTALGVITGLSRTPSVERSVEELTSPDHSAAMGPGEPRLPVHVLAPDADGGAVRGLAALLEVVSGVVHGHGAPVVVVAPCGVRGAAAFRVEPVDE